MNQRERHLARLAQRKALFDEYWGAQARGEKLSMREIAERHGVTTSRISYLIGLEYRRRWERRQRLDPPPLHPENLDLYDRWQHWTPWTQYREFEVLNGKLIKSDRDENSIGFVYAEDLWREWNVR